MNHCKRITKILLIVLGILALVSLFMGNMMILFAMLFAILFIYYLIVYFITKKCSKIENKINVYIVFILFFIPIIWVLIDWEGFFNFMLQGVHLDMRH